MILLYQPLSLTTCFNSEPGRLLHSKANYPIFLHRLPVASYLTGKIPSPYIGPVGPTRSSLLPYRSPPYQHGSRYISLFSKTQNAYFKPLPFFFRYLFKYHLLIEAFLLIFLKSVDTTTFIYLSIYLSVCVQWILNSLVHYCILSI